MKEIREAIEMKTSGNCKRVVVAGCLVQRHKTKLLNDAPGIDRLVGVFDREHIVEAVRGKENPRQEHGHFLGKYHDLSNELQEGKWRCCRQWCKAVAGVSKMTRARLRLTPQGTLLIFALAKGATKVVQLLHDPQHTWADAIETDRNRSCLEARKNWPPMARWN